MKKSITSMAVLLFSAVLCFSELAAQSSDLEVHGWWPGCARFWDPMFLEHPNGSESRNWNRFYPMPESWFVAPGVG